MKHNQEHECECGHEHHDKDCHCGHDHAHDCSHDDCGCGDPGCDCEGEDEDKEHLHQPSKYDAALAKYETNLDDAAVTQVVDAIIEARVAENNTEEVKKRILSCLDLTSLRTTDTEEDILHMVERVNRFDDAHPDLPCVAAVCTYPNFSHLVSQSLEADKVEVAAVSGGFPSSQTFTEVKVAETAMALHEGATEIDIVMGVGKFLDGNYEDLCDEIDELKSLCGEKLLKVILETGLLRSAANVKRASILAMYSGADFIKTSTGKDGSAATPEAAYVMCQAIKEYHEQTGRMVGFKAAGGIRSVHDALVYYSIVKELLGTEWLTPRYFRIGASSLADALVSDIVGEDMHCF